jgi:phospholipid/cholesterol/gamma-HCH transport system substrate-binding protein
MRTSNNRRRVIVGVFVLIGLAILVMTILTLGSQKRSFEKTITVKSFFDNVNGLQKGNNIWFSGVKVGTIKKVYITQTGQVEVEMGIEKSSTQFIRKDAKAKLSTDGLIGNKIIELYGGTLKLPEVEDGDVLYTDKLLSTDEMMVTLSKNNENLLAITNDFKSISSDLAAGKGSIGQLLKNETFANQLTATTVTLQNAAKNLQALSANVSTYTAKLNTPGTLANDLVSDTVVFSQMRATLAQLREVANTSQKAIANFENAGVTLNNALASKNTPIGTLLNDQKASDNIKSSLENLKSATIKLNDDLEAVQHNFLLRGFFKKKAKADKENMRVVLDTIVEP